MRSRAQDPPPKRRMEVTQWQLLRTASSGTRGILRNVDAVLRRACVSPVVGHIFQKKFDGYPELYDGVDDR